MPKNLSNKVTQYAPSEIPKLREEIKTSEARQKESAEKDVYNNGVALNKDVFKQLFGITTFNFKWAPGQWESVFGEGKNK